LEKILDFFLLLLPVDDYFRQIFFRKNFQLDKIALMKTKFFKILSLTRNAEEGKRDDEELRIN